MPKLQLLNVNDNAKTVKNSAYGFLTGILYLAPANISGTEVCPSSDAGCRQACLYSAGRGKFTSVQTARIRKTRELFRDRQTFIRTLASDIELLSAMAERDGLLPSIRLNGTSDLGWEGFARELFTVNSDLQFYDYTKIKNRAMRFLAGKMPTNYHLTFSRSATNSNDCKDVLNAGGNVAAVFRYPELPAQYDGFTVINGDDSDLRFLDPQNVIVGLKAKGSAKSDTSGFVIG